MLIIGHRGAKGEAPENTLAALERCIDSGADMAEFDLRTTRDGVVVLAHNPWFGKIWRQIAWTNYPKLLKISNKTGAPIATLDEALQVLGDKIGVNAEFKRRSAVKPAFEIFNKHFPNQKNQEHILMLSFWPQILKRIRQFWPQVNLGFLLCRNFQPFARVVRKYQLQTVGFCDKRLTAKLVSKAKNLNLMTYVYPIGNDDFSPSFLQFLTQISVDGFSTNHPTQAAKWRD
jgi:glycerophosphoryl diester phosphodiesterase